MTATPYVTADQVRAAVTGLSDADLYTDGAIEDAVSEWEGLIEDDLGFPLTPRSGSVVAVTSWRHPIQLNASHVTAITSFAYDVGDAPNLTTGVKIMDGFELIRLPFGCLWPEKRLATIGFTYGLTTTPPAAIAGAIEFARAEVILRAGSQPRNVIGERTDLGWIPEPLADLSKRRLTRWTICNEKIDQLRSQFNERGPSIG